MKHLHLPVELYIVHTSIQLAATRSKTKRGRVREWNRDRRTDRQTDSAAAIMACVSAASDNASAVVDVVGANSIETLPPARAFRLSADRRVAEPTVATHYGNYDTAWSDTLRSRRCRCSCIENLYSPIMAALRNRTNVNLSFLFIRSSLGNWKLIIIIWRIKIFIAGFIYWMVIIYSLTCLAVTDKMSCAMY